MKRVISLLLTLLMVLSSVSVMAADPATVTAKADYTAKVINVVYNNTANYDCYVTIYMVDADVYNDAVFEDYADGDVVRMATVEAAASGATNVELILGSDIKTGDYNFYAAPSGVDGSAYYAKIAQPLHIIGETADAGDETVADILAYVNAGDASNISNRVYEKLSAALDVTSDPAWRNAYLYAIKDADYAGSFKSLTEIGDAVEIANALYEIRIADEASIEAAIQNGSAVLGMDINNADYTNETFHDYIVSLYAEKIAANNATTKVSNLKYFNEAVALAVINTGTAAQKAVALETYQDALGISDALLALIKGENAGADVVARHLDGFTTTEPSELVEKITTILAGIGNEPSKDQTNPSYIGGGNGGGVGGVTIPNEYASQTTTPDYTTTFSDVPGSHWANAPVEYLANIGVVAGKGNGKFDPDGIVTREEFVKMIVAAFKYTNAGEGIDFADVPSSHWAYSYIKIAYENNIVKGLSDTAFGVGSPITRQDMAVIISRVVADKQITLSGTAESFADGGKIADYAKAAVAELAGAGVLNGYTDGTFKPEGSLTRAEAAKVIYALVNR